MSSLLIARVWWAAVPACRRTPLLAAHGAGTGRRPGPASLLADRSAARRARQYRHRALAVSWTRPCATPTDGGLYRDDCATARNQPPLVARASCSALAAPVGGDLADHYSPRAPAVCRFREIRSDDSE